MNAISIILLAGVVLLLFLTIRKIVKNRGKSCSCCSSSCPMKGQCSKKEK